MKLHYKKLGEGTPLIILHGLFGLSDNWQSLGKQFAKNGLEVFLVDQRNHGHSPHSELWDYESMSDDVLELMNDNALTKAILLGHSMGGKTVMHTAVKNSDRIQKLIVADIAPKYYPIHHDTILKALHAIDLSVVKSRKEAEETMTAYIRENSTKQFLLKSLYWSEHHPPQLQWRFNLPVISANIEKVGEATPIPASGTLTNLPALFIRGGQSNYVKDTDMELIAQIFPAAKLETITDAGHWLHAEKPVEFYNAVMNFILNS